MTAPSDTPDTPTDAAPVATDAPPVPTAAPRRLARHLVLFARLAAETVYDEQALLANALERILGDRIANEGPEAGREERLHELVAEHLGACRGAWALARGAHWVNAQARLSASVKLLDELLAEGLREHQRRQQSGSAALPTERSAP